MANKKIIVVLGMHRSGTSAFTRSLKVLGVDLGNKLMQPIANINDKGFFEDLDINQFNDYLLNKMACVWSSCSIPQDKQLELLDNQADIDTAVQLLNNKLQNTDLFGFKDPRVSVLLPFWQKIFKLCNFNVSYLIAIRNPLSVAYSLQKRDQFSIKKGLFLWFEYMLASMQQTQNLNRVLVHYENLMLDPVTQINTIAQNLNLTINNQELNSFTDDFLDPNLQHSNLTLEDLKKHVDYVESVYQLYEYFLNINQQNSVENVNLNNIINLFEIEITPYINELKFQDIFYGWSPGNRQPYINELKFQDSLAIKIKEIAYANLSLGNERIKLIEQLEEHIKIIHTERKEIFELNERIKSNVKHIEFMEVNMLNITNSLSWKLTQPLRSLMKLIR